VQSRDEYHAAYRPAGFPEAADPAAESGRHREDCGRFQSEVHGERGCGRLGAIVSFHEKSDGTVLMVHVPEYSKKVCTV